MMFWSIRSTFRFPFDKLRGLRARLALLVLLPLIPVLLMVLWSDSHMRARELAEAEARSLVLVQLAASRGENLFGDAFGLVARVPWLPEVTGRRAGDCQAALEQLRAQTPIYLGVGVITPDGSFFCGVGDLPESRQILDHSFFAGVMGTKYYRFGPFEAAPRSGAPSVMLGAPVLDQAGEVQIVAFVNLGLNWLDVIAEQDLPEGTALSIFDEQLGVVTQRTHGGVPHRLDRDLLVPALQSNPKGLLRIDEDGQNLHAAVIPWEMVEARTAPSTPYVVASIPHESILASVNSLRDRNLVTIGIVVLLALSAAWAGGEWLVLRPVRVLAAASRRLAEGDWTARTGIERGAGEVHQLAYSFDRMARALQDRSRAQVEAEARLRDSEALTRSILDSMDREGFWSVDARSFHLVYHSTGLEAVYGVPIHEFTVRGGWKGLAHPDDLPLMEEMERCLADGRAHELEHRIIRPDGEVRWVSCRGVPIRDGDRRVIRFNGVVTDITARRQAEEALQHQALHDALTGLPNRTLLRDRLGQALRGARRGEQKVGLLLMDLDLFKEVNDTFGHEAGDRVLEEVSARLCSAVREIDTVARLGGDEFALILPGLTDPESATMIARKLIQVLGQPITVHHQPVAVGASIGISIYPEHGMDAEALLRCADVAMYSAKRSRTGLAIYAPNLDHYSADRLALSSDLRTAVEAGQLVLHYQPKAHARTGEVTGVEALLRWQHPDRGLIPPAQFIPLAERTGFIAALSRWVLEQAIRQCRAWRDQGLNLHVAVNLSTQNLQDPGLADTVAELLEASGLPGSSLELEITENALMADYARALSTLGRLQEQGIKIAIDDFGTGYSSLVYLQKLPVDQIKIDRSFVSGMRFDESDAAIVRSTVDLGHNLGLHVVAEGVEDRETWDLLDQLGCDSVQGDYLGAPMPPEALASWLAESGRSMVTAAGILTGR